ncbi:D-aminoacyl-tRNA deacylase [Irregularibacter muris]|uniref:D-aminoacyl-tRNA deacylase n=1 Tax=Irregularibacter muris TaxID=1796619 RepID=A0AAE3HEU7_9FIRM|nr:D-aminoacyl-tRNA deacylase [Irregularibacter muris]MCR1898205.1 D-aminoacyl-tRNA deacylase [Irregularibacter muris]
MRAVVQRVNFSHIEVDQQEVGRIGKGLLVLLGVKNDDTEEDVNYLVDKIINLRIFEDREEKMNLSLMDIGGELLVASQFTLYGDCKKGRRPSFTMAAKPERAEKLYEKFVEKTRGQGIRTQTGKFQTHMLVNLQNDGPVTMLIDSEKLF